MSRIAHEHNPICRHCRYDLITQLELLDPHWTPADGPIDIHCPECDTISTWPWVAPPPAPNRVPLIPFVLSVVFIAVIGVLLFA